MAQCGEDILDDSDPKTKVTCIIERANDFQPGAPNYYYDATHYNSMPTVTRNLIKNALAKISKDVFVKILTDTQEKATTGYRNCLIADFNEMHKKDENFKPIEYEVQDSFVNKLNPLPYIGKLVGLGGKRTKSKRAKRRKTTKKRKSRKM